MRKYIILTVLFFTLPIVSFTQIPFSPPAGSIIVPIPNYNPFFNPYYPNLYYNRYTPYNPYYGVPTMAPMVFGRPSVSMGLVSTIGINPTLPSLGMYWTIGSENIFFKMSYERSRILENDSTSNNNPTINDDTMEIYSSLFLGLGAKATDTIYPFLGANIYQTEYEPYSIDGWDEKGINMRGGVLFRKNNFEVGTSLTAMKPIRFGLNIGFNF